MRHCPLVISMLPLASVSWSWQPPDPIVPFSISGAMLPTAVIGKSEEMRPKDVRAVTL
jgi:hypothetical protein